MNPALLASGLACLAGVAACAAPAPAAPAAAPVAAAGAGELRLLVKLAQPSTDPASIAREASAAAGVPARYLSGTSPQWHALALRCGSAAECDAALGRLRADGATFEAIQLDERRRQAAP
jgi:hypothetical protein